jgi:hypothetical protein
MTTQTATRPEVDCVSDEYVRADGAPTYAVAQHQVNRR